MHGTILRTAKGAWLTEEYDRYKRAQASRWLEHVRRLGGKCRALQREVEEQRALASGLKGLDYSAPVVRSSASADGTPEAVIRLFDVIEEYCTELADYVEEQHAAHAALNDMSDELGAEALKRHYLCGQSWESCCVDMGYSWDGMMSLRKRAVLELYDHIPTEWRDPLHQAV